MFGRGRPPDQAFADEKPQHFLYFLPLPQGQGSLRPALGPDRRPEGLHMLRKGGRYIIAGIVFPNADVTLDTNLILNKLLTIQGVHNYHPRHLVEALDFVYRNRGVFPFKEIVDGRFGLDDLDTAFKQAAERQVLRAAIVP